MLGARSTFPALSTSKGRGACWGSEMGVGRVTSILIIHSKLHLVKIMFGTPLVLGQVTGDFGFIRFTMAQTWGKPPLVSKLPGFGLLQLCKTITLCSDLWLGWGLKQSCSSRQELSKDVSHCTCMHSGLVNSWLFVVGSQTVNLTPSLSFCHNLCCKCPNGSCKPILDIYTSIAF
jgi:hypothetical protein